MKTQEKLELTPAAVGAAVRAAIETIIENAVRAERQAWQNAVRAEMTALNKDDDAQLKLWTRLDCLVHSTKAV